MYYIVYTIYIRLLSRIVITRSIDKLTVISSHILTHYIIYFFTRSYFVLSQTIYTPLVLHNSNVSILVAKIITTDHRYILTSCRI